MPIVADEIRVPGLNAISEMKREAVGCTGMGNFKTALGIETEEIKINPQKPQIKTKNPQQNKAQNKPNVFQQARGFDTYGGQFIIQSSELIKCQHKKPE